MPEFHEANDESTPAAAEVAEGGVSAGADWFPQREAPRSTGSGVSAGSAAVPASEGARRLLHLPVTVTVRLAEKKIELGQLLALCPGALITFNKSCDELLDLYINNRHYCRGEAVKIGEKFGLKITEVGVEETREERIVNG